MYVRRMRLCPLTFSCGAVSASPMWRSQAEVDGLTLVKADNKTGYFCVA